MHSIWWTRREGALSHKVEVIRHVDLAHAVAPRHEQTTKNHRLHVFEVGNSVHKAPLRLHDESCGRLQWSDHHPDSGSRQDIEHLPS